MHPEELKDICVRLSAGRLTFSPVSTGYAISFSAFETRLEIVLALSHTFRGRLPD